jgi:hypothetical protein
MFGFSSVDEIVSANTYKPQAPKARKPMKTGDGTVLEDAEQFRLPGSGKPALIWDGRRDNPLDGKKCAVRRCREGVQWVIHQRLDGDLEDVIPPQGYVPSDNPLVIQLERAQAAMLTRPAEIVDVGTPVYLCIRHYTEFMAARNAKVVAQQAARTAPSWPLHQLNYEGAAAEVIDSKTFRITDGAGRMMVLPIWPVRNIGRKC